MDGARMIQIIRENSGSEAPSIAVVTSLSSSELRSSYDLPEDITVFEKPVSYAQLQRLATTVYNHKYE